MSRKTTGPNRRSAATTCRTSSDNTDAKSSASVCATLEFSDDPGLFVPLQLDQDVLLGREVKVERAPHHARCGGDGTDVGAGQAAPADLSQCGVE